MSEVLVGSAYFTAELRYQQLSQGVSAVEQQIQRLQALSKTPITIAPPSAGAGASQISQATAAQQRYVAETQRATQAQQQAALIAQRTATERQRTATATTNAARAEQLLARDTANAARAQDQAATSALRRAEAQARAARQAQNGGNGPALPRTFAGFTPGGFAQALGAFGLATIGPQIVGQAVGAGADAGRNAILLDRTLRLTKELTGTQAQYNQVIQTARQQQVLYGGSLQENIAGIQGLVVTARSTGAELQTLINLAQRLAVLDPAQGAEGARIALSEVLSGDPRSLARRYEIPLSALERIKDESVPVAERLAVLDGYLNKIGITSATVTKVVTDQAKAYNVLGQELSDLQTNAGSGLANAFEAPARGLGRLIGLINQNPQAVAELKALLGRTGPVDTSDIEQAADDLARARASRLLSGDPNQPQQRQLNTRRLGGAETAEPVIRQLTELIQKGGEAQQKAEALAIAFTDQQLGADGLRRGLNELTQQEQTLAGIEQTRIQNATADLNARQAAIDKIAQLTSGMRASAEASALDAAQKQAQQAQTALVAQQTNAAVDSFLRLNPGIDAAGIAAQVTAGKIPLLIGQLAQLQLQTDANTAAFNRLALQQNIAAGSGGASKPFLGGLTNTTSGLAGTLGGGAGGVFSRVDADQRALQDSRDALALARAKTRAERIAIYERQLARQATEEGRNRILAQIESERQTGVSAGKGRVSAAESTALQLQNVEQNSGLQLARIQRENLQRLADQQEDFDVRRTRSREDYERQRIRLLSQGQRAQAERLREEFERDQRRELEDFTRQRRRTLRDNAERSGDTTDRADLRTSQIQDRAALRGVAVSGARRPDLGEAPPQLTGGAGTGGGVGLFTLRVEISPQPIVLDGKVIGEATWPTIEQLIDAELATELGTIGIVLPPGGGNAAIAGGRP